MAYPRLLSKVTAMVFTLALAPLSWTASSQFVVARHFPAGNFPASTAVADFNGDGKLDIALLQLDSNQVSIRLNNGNGTFQKPKIFPTGVVSPVSLAIADVNKDNRPDLVIFNSPVDGSAATVSILLGNGDGTFQSPKTAGIGSFPSVVAFADFNGDGHLDMVSANPGNLDPYGPPSLLILLGNGDGTFKPAKQILPGSTPEWVAVGDFNGDGKADLAVANGNPQAISILLGNGDGTFKPATNFFGVGLPSFVAAEELDGDHNLDLIVANTSNNSVAVLLGNGDGNFRTAQNFAAGVRPSLLVMDDFNGDNKLDVAVLPLGPGPVSVLLGNSNGKFGRATLYDAGQAISWLAAGDLNGDRKPDLITVNTTKPGSLTFLQGKGDGTFLAARDFSTFATSVGSVAGDFNGDGKPDLVFITDFPTSLTVLLGTGHGTFGAPKITSLASSNSIAQGDFNHDGKLDLAVTDTDHTAVDILLGNGDGTFQTAKKYPVSSVPFNIAVGDFNHDGNLDLVVATGLPGQPGDLNVLLGNSDGTFKPATRIPFMGASQVVVGDFNGDGNLDFIAAQAPFTDLTLFVGKGNGKFQAVNLPPFGGGPLLVTDLNNDGKLDLIVGVSGNAFGVNVLLGNGNGTFQKPVFTSLPLHNPPFLALGDFNRDGNVDLVASSFADSIITLVLGDGKGGFQAPVVFPVAATPSGFAVADFNLDQALDVAVGIPGQAGASGTGSTTVLLNTGSRAHDSSLLK